MGIIRGGLVALISIMLFLSLLSMNIFMTMSLSLKYDVIKPKLSNLILNTAKENIDINQFDNLIKLYCQNNNSFPIKDFINDSFVVDEEISCDLALQEGSEAVLKDMIDKGIDKSYYAEYNCTVFNCNEGNEENQQAFSIQKFLFLFSEQIKDYWKKWFYWTIVLSIILCSLLFFLMENRSSFPFLVGGLLIVASLPFLGLDWLIMKLTKEYFQFVLLYFSKSYFTFLFGTILGVVLIILGIAVKFLNIGDKIFGFFRKS